MDGGLGGVEQQLESLLGLQKFLSSHLPSFLFSPFLFSLSLSLPHFSHV